MSKEIETIDEEVSGDMSFLRGLNEAKIFRNKSDLRSIDHEVSKDLLYLNTLALYALSQESNTADWSQEQASRTAMFNNFDKFKVGYPDLYNLAHIHLGKTSYGDVDIISQMKKNPMTSPMYIRFLRGIAAGQNMDKNATQFFLRFEKALGVDNGVYKTIRRSVSNWNNISPDEKKSALTRLYKFTLANSPRSEFLMPIKQHIGLIAGLSKTQKVALGIGVLAAGFAVGYKMTRDDTIRTKS